MNLKITKTKLLNFLIVIGLLILPYYMFKGGWYVGGDDTRLFYFYPQEYLKNIVFYSWTNFSSLSSYNPNQFMIPFLFLTAILQFIIPSKTVVGYFLFSLPLIIGFLSFQLLLFKLLPKKDMSFERIIGATIYVLSPISLQHQLAVFLVTIWAYALFPLIVYFYINYLESRKYKYILFAVILMTIFSLGFYGLIWILGLLFPLVIAGIFTIFLFKKKFVIDFLKKTVIFLIFCILSQSFWLVSFFQSILVSINNFGANPLSSSMIDTFRPIVTATAVGNIIYPLLLLPNRAIVFSYNWQIKSAFEALYDKLLIPNFIFLIVIFLGLFLARKYQFKEKKIYFIFLLTFVLSLFFLVVNIGFFKEVFLFLGYLPGFSIFRNFYDKFAFGYVFYYGIIFTFSLYIIKNVFKFKKKYFYPGLLLLLFLILLINASPVKEIVDSPLWKTKSISRVPILPSEYINFLNKVENEVDSQSNIISFPLNIALYSMIPGQNHDETYIGTSPVRIFTGLTNLSGYMSFPTSEYLILQNSLEKRDYKELLSLFKKYNIHYLLYQKNIPQDVLHSYLYDPLNIKQQNDEMIRSLTSNLLLKSSRGNYSLYKTKENEENVDKNIKYVRVSPIEYQVILKEINKNKTVHLYEPFSSGWKVFPKEIKEKPSIYVKKESLFSDLSNIDLLFNKSAFENKHTLYNNYGNTWSISRDDLTKYFDRPINNRDEVVLTIYFYPQIFFYIGVLVSLINVIVIIYLYKKHEKTI